MYVNMFICIYIYTHTWNKNNYQKGDAHPRIWQWGRPEWRPLIAASSLLCCGQPRSCKVSTNFLGAAIFG